MGMSQQTSECTHGSKLLDHIWVSANLDIARSLIFAPLEKKKAGLPVHSVVGIDMSIQSDSRKQALPCAPRFNFNNADWDGIAVH